MRSFRSQKTSPSCVRAPPLRNHAGKHRPIGARRTHGRVRTPSPAGRTSDIKDDVRLNVENPTVMGVEGRPAVDGASITIRSGEIVGIAGVEGNEYELCAVFLALCHHLARSLLTAPTSRKQPPGRDMMGLAYIPFDRHREGLMLNAPLWETHCWVEKTKISLKRTAR